MRLFLYIIICLFTFRSYAELSDSKAINKLKSYLAEIKSVAVDFKQTDSNKATAFGKLLINKPYKFRCNYYPPFPLLIVGNKNYVSVYDYDMNNLSRIKSTENIFNFLMTDLNFDKHFHIKSIKEDEHYITAKIYHDLSERSSQIIFDKLKNRIHSLEILEDSNTITITFGKMIKVRSFSNELFYIQNPDVFGVPKRFTETELSRKYSE